MKFIQKTILLGLILLLFIGILPGTSGSIIFSKNLITNEDTNENVLPLSSPGSNEDILNDILDAKVGQFQTGQFFNGLYETSIHATYYAIYTLFTIEKRGMVNEDTIINFLMSHYNDTTRLFEDEYSDRYIDTDFDMIYFPLTSLLEVNCYAILTLDMLGALDQINTQDTIDFIWSCYNPVTSGFIGQPYNASLEEGFKVSTMDNTYYAIITLDLLMDDWTASSQEKDDIVSFVNSLQNLDGSFDNDLDSSIETLQIWEPNPISAWYVVKVLELFNQVDTINLTNLRTYLESLYDSDRNFFKTFTYSGYEQYSDLISSATCVEVSDIVLFNNYDRTATIQFILDNRNGIGNWNDGTRFDYHELLYTFMIIRALYDTGSLATLTAQEIDEIGSSTTYYQDGIGGYAIISKDYTPMKTLYSIVNSLMIEGKYDELTLSEKEALYTSILNVYQTTPYGNSAFYYNIGMDPAYVGFKTYPVDLFSTGSRVELNIIEYATTHKNTYLALQVLEKMFKLDDLAMSYNLTGFINHVINSQFLEAGYDECGGFIPTDGMLVQPIDLRAKSVFFEHSYYAIKILELLTGYMGIGDINDVPIDPDAFITYIYRNIQQTGDTLWYQPRYTNNMDIILKNTYFAIDALQILDAFNLDVQKIYNFIFQNIDYSNIQNIYYCHEIINALGLDNFIDYDVVKALIPVLYEESIGEFYLTSQRNETCQEALWWACEMANSGVIQADITFINPVSLGTSVNISVALKNMIYNVSTQYYLVYFESSQLGTIPIDAHDSSFWKEIFIPIDPDMYPLISGTICVYKSGVKKLVVPVDLDTTYETNEEFNINKLADGNIEFSALSQLIIDGEPLPAGLYGFQVRVDVYIDDQYLQSVYLDTSGTLFDDRTEYYLKYEPQAYGEYHFEVYYEDPIQQNAINVGSDSISYSGSAGVYQGAEGAGIIGASVIGVVLAVSSTGVMVFSTKKRGALHKKFNR